MSNETNIQERPEADSPGEFKIFPVVTLEEMRVRYVRWAVDHFGGNKKAAADALGVSRGTIHNILKRASAN